MSKQILEQSGIIFTDPNSTASRQLLNAFQSLLALLLALRFQGFEVWCQFQFRNLVFQCVENSMTWLMIKHHMQDHLVVGRIPVMSMGLPSRTLKMDFNGTVEKIITNGEPGSLEIWILALVPPAWRKNLDFFPINGF